MSERVFRLVTGLILWGILVFSTIYQNKQLMIAFCMLLLFEGVTNWRIPTLVNKIVTKVRLGHFNAHEQVPIVKVKHTVLGNIEAERMIRFMIVFFLFFSYFLFPEILWFFPWYVAGMMIVSGISNICPMVMFLRWVGFR